MRGPSVAAIVLAAGFSRRLGRPKQSVVLAGETLVERAARTALEAGLAPVLVVLDARTFASESGKLTTQGCTCLQNEEAAEGMAASLRLGVQALDEEVVAGVVVMTCDQVAVTANILQALCAEPERTAGSGYAGRVGVPAYFPASCFADLLRLRGDQGARELLRTARCVPNETLALDVDTDEQLRQAEAWIAGRAPVEP